MHAWEDPKVYQRRDCEPDKSKWSVKGKREEIPHISDLNYHSGVTLSLPRVSIHNVLIFPLNKSFACFTTFSLCGNSFLQSQRARAWWLTTDPWLGFRALTDVTQPQSQEPKPCLKMMQAEANQDDELCLRTRAQACLTLWDPMDCSLPGSSLHGQEYWSGLLFSTPGDLMDPGIGAASLVSPVLAGGIFTTVLPGKPLNFIT